MLNNKGIIDLKGLALGIGVFILILGIMGVVLGETKTAINSAEANVNITLDKGVTAMLTGSKFGSTLIIVGVLAAIIGLFAFVKV